MVSFQLNKIAIVFSTILILYHYLFLIIKAINSAIMKKKLAKQFLMHDIASA